MTGALSIHYAEALANSIFKPNSGLSPEDAVAQLASAEEAFNGSKDLQAVLLSPAVTRTRKSAVVRRIAEELQLHPLIRNFLEVVVKHGRTRQLRDIRRSFETVVDEHLGWVPAEILSAHELSEAQRQHIEQALGTKLGKFIRAHYKVDQTLLGGVRARVGAKEYDATLRGRLENLRQRLHIGY